MDVAASRTSELVQFVSKHRWIYDVQVTRLFVEQWWKTVPNEWQIALSELSEDELNQVPFGFIKGSWPDSLKQFILQSQHLSLTRSVPPSVAMAAVDVSSKVKVGMTPKKAHEVSLLAGIVKEMCTSSNCQIVLDIGSGLGYLGDCLCEQCGLSVVGLERETERVVAAKRREHIDTYDDEEESCDLPAMSCDSLCGPRRPSHDSHTEVPRSSVQCSHHLSTDWSLHLYQLLPLDLKWPFHVSTQLNIDTTHRSTTKLCQLLLYLQRLDSVKGDLRVCVVGLHCCGDLASSTLTLFTHHSLPSLTTLVLVPCCYHKMASPQWQPSSATLRRILGERQDVAINTFALRLAAQETKHRWQLQSKEHHNQHERRVAYRGMLEAVTGGNGIPRKALRKLKIDSIEEYAKTVAANLSDNSLEQQLLSYYTNHKMFIKLIEPFTALQVCLQGVMERLVLEDALCLLKEKGVLSASMSPVFDPEMSPRNMAIMATK